MSGPKPRWWQRRRRKAWKAGAARALAEAFNAAAVEMAKLFAPVVVTFEPFSDDSPRNRQERARRILKGGVN